MVASASVASAAFTNIDCSVLADRQVLGGGAPNELPQADCEFIQSIFDNTTMTDSTGWDTADDINNWYGLERTTTGELRFVDLQNNGVTGDASLFTNPSTVAGLIRLDLRNNSLTGDIESWDFSGLTSFNTLRLTNNGTGLIGDISTWVMPSTMLFFQIGDNGFTGDMTNYDTQLPAGIRSFSIGNNDFVGDLTNWDVSGLHLGNGLVLASNEFEGDLGAWTFSATQGALVLSDNKFDGDIPDFTGFPGALLSLGQNKFIASTPAKDAAADAAAGGDISVTQTVPPVISDVLQASASSAVVQLVPYEYGAVGDFNVLYGTTMSGPYTTGPVTTARSAGVNLAISGIVPNTVYYGVVEADTPANAGGNVLVATSTEFLMAIQTAPDLATASDNGTSNTDNVTSVTTPTIEGECIAGATVELYIDGVATGDTGVCTAAGTYSIGLTTALAVGNTYDITHTQEDAATGLDLDESPAVAISITAPVATSSGGGGGGSNKACRDPEALNYKTFGKSDPDRCIYEESTEEKVDNIVKDNEKDEESDDLVERLRALLAQVLAAKITGVETSATCPAFTQYMRFGDRDGAQALSRQNVGVSSTISQVAKLQKELKAQGLYNGPVTGFFGVQTRAAVNAWQVKHASEVLTPWGLQGPTGWFYQSSERWMNELKGCSDSVRLDNGVQLN